jgi:hypothetical protein
MKIRLEAFFPSLTLFVLQISVGKEAMESLVHT